MKTKSASMTGIRSKGLIKQKKSLPWEDKLFFKSTENCENQIYIYDEGKLGHPK